MLLLPFPLFQWLPLLQRLHSAFFTLPSLRDWALGLGLLLLYALIAIPWGLGLPWTVDKSRSSSFLRWQPVTAPLTIVTTLGIALIFPALMEELLFRVMLLPSPHHPYFYGWAALALILFILAHPLNALLFFPHRKATFFNPLFLILAGLLGGLCTIAYQSSGSLWLPLLLHWIPVVLWLLCWGGLERMAPPTDSPPS
ncbi:MAG: type II CAAX prenyl endopeptidase Rce1 family protein [Prochlorotrichaceae cyanobacterium]|jgi:predicted Abi (CAAX) family protease